MQFMGLKSCVLAVAALGVTPQAYSGDCPWDCGDFNGNVGIVDFLTLLSQWDDVGTSCDFDGGGVGIVDFLKLLANWGVCPGVCSGASGDCCADNGTPGCNDPICCDAVCSLDPFCCQMTWDGQCADLASKVCDDCTDACLNASGNCCDANGTPGCDDPMCCDAVCSLDPFCCDVTWDGNCADLASQVCDACMGGGMNCGDPGTGDCCVANGSPACDDFFCCDFVCSLDPFCCDAEWDATCADLAAQVCVICP